MSLAGHLLSNLKQHITVLELEPGDGGCFEVTVDDELMYSKLETGEFPDNADVYRDVAARAS